MTRLVVLVLAHGDQPHLSNQIAQRQTWALVLPEGVEVFWVYDDIGASKVTCDRDRNVFVPVSREEAAAPKYGASVEKTGRAMGWAVDSFQPNYLLRTNTSSYFSLDLLLAELTQLPKSGVYRGVIGHGNLARGAAVEFVSGAAMLVTPDIADVISPSSGTPFCGELEDLTIGAILGRKGVKPISASRIDMTDGAPLSAGAHVRLKSYTDDARTADRMRKVHEVFSCRRTDERADLLRRLDVAEVRRVSMESLKQAVRTPNRATVRQALSRISFGYWYVAERRRRALSLAARSESFEPLFPVSEGHA